MDPTPFLVHERGARLTEAAVALKGSVLALVGRAPDAGGSTTHLALLGEDGAVRGLGVPLRSCRPTMWSALVATGSTSTLVAVVGREGPSRMDASDPPSRARQPYRWFRVECERGAISCEPVDAAERSTADSVAMSSART